MIKESYYYYYYYFIETVERIGLVFGMAGASFHLSYMYRTYTLYYILSGTFKNKGTSL